MINAEKLAFIEVMTIIFLRWKQPYQPFVCVEIREFFIHVIGLSPEEAENEIPS